MSTTMISSSSIQDVCQKALRDGDTSKLKKLLQNTEETSGLNVNRFDLETGQTLLHESCYAGNLEVVKLLVQFGADIRMANRDGWSALHIASYEGHRDIVLFLIANSRSR